MSRPSGGPARRRQLPGGLAPLGHKDFALFWIGWATTRFGRAVGDTAALWLVYELTSSPALLGLMGLARAVPSTLLSPVAGAVADRVDQRKILFVTQGLGGIAPLCAGVLVATNLVEFWHLYILIAVQSAIEAFDGGARLALFPRLVPRGLLPDAVTMNSTASRTAQLVGPVVGGMMIAGLGEAAGFFLNAATFLGLIGAVTMMRPPALAHPGADDGSLWSEMWDSLRHLARAPVLSGLLLLEVVVSIVQINSVIITVFGREILDVAPEGLGGLLSAPAFGSVLAILGLLVLGHAHRQGRFVLVCGVAYAAALVALAGTGTYVLAFALLTFIGLMDGLMTVTRHSVMQLVSPAPMRGRVMGWMGTITRGMSPLGEVQSGAVSGIVGSPAALAAAGAVLGAAAGVTALTNRSLWRFRRDPAPSAGKQEPLAEES
jgi:MFS family permease